MTPYTITALLLSLWVGLTVFWNPAPADEHVLYWSVYRNGILVANTATPKAVIDVSSGDVIEVRATNSAGEGPGALLELQLQQSEDLTAWREVTAPQPKPRYFLRWEYTKP